MAPQSTEQRPPAAPPALPPTAYQDSGDGGAGHRVQVTRNVPPKRVMVLPGNTVVYAGQTYYGQGVYLQADTGEQLVVAEGDTFLHGEGPVADQLAFSGHVVVLSHEEVAAWNGEEGDEIRKQGLAEIDAIHKRAKTERTHNHGLEKYEHADGEDAIPVDVTQHRQQVAQAHMLEGRHAEQSDFGGKKGGSG